MYNSLSIILLCFICQVFLTINNARVLVVGGTGRVGRNIVQQLVNQGMNPKVLVRDMKKAQSIPQLSGADLIQGDIHRYQSLVDATTRDIEAIIDVHGVSPPRKVKFPSDLFHNYKIDQSHPYTINYLGVKSILQVMKEKKIQKLIRITGSLVNKSAFNPFIVLFNFLLSFSNKWHEESEKLIRAANIDYTVIRPTGLVDEPRAKELDNRELILLPSDSNITPKVPAKISIYDIADLCVKSLYDSRLRKSTVVVSSGSGTGSSDWASLLTSKHIKSDTIPLRENNPHRIAVVVYATIFFIATASFFKLLYSGFQKMLTCFMKYKL